MCFRYTTGTINTETCRNRNSFYSPLSPFSSLFAAGEEAEGKGFEPPCPFERTL